MVHGGGVKVTRRHFATKNRDPEEERMQTFCKSNMIILPTCHSHHCPFADLKGHCPLVFDSHDIGWL